MTPIPQEDREGKRKSIREKYESESGEKHWTNPVAHGELAFASWKYQLWLEDSLDLAIYEKERAEGELKKIAELVIIEPSDKERGGRQ